MKTLIKNGLQPASSGRYSDRSPDLLCNRNFYGNYGYYCSDQFCTVRDRRIYHVTKK